MARSALAVIVFLTVSFSVHSSPGRGETPHRPTFADSSVGLVPERTICGRIFSLARAEQLSRLPMGELVARLGTELVGSPYEAHTLERSGQEHVIPYLRGFDCVTFVENVLALSRSVKRQNLNFETYVNELRTIRYRGGVVAGYPSRLHYFSEWINDNQRKGIVRNLTGELGGESFSKPLSWMTKHRGAYRQMEDAGVFKRIAEVEKNLSVRELFSISRGRIDGEQSGIRNGDIIAMVSRRDGLDVDHVGFAVRQKDGSLHYMHAPNEKGTVRISDETLGAHVAGHPSYSGIMVVRPEEPR